MVVRTDISVGDERQWRKVYHVTTVTPAAELLERIAKGMAGMQGWSRVAETHRWTSQQEGRQVGLSFETNPESDAKSYRLELRVDTKTI